MRALAWVLGLSLLIAVGAAAQQARDLSGMSAAEIKALQQRLAADGCYQGAIDGQARPALADAIKACPSQDPILRIETGMHTALSTIGVDRDCRLLVSGSEDKTVRLWSLPEVRLLKTLRWPIGSGSDGQVYAVAVSPDGKLVVVGGWDANPTFDSAYIFDAGSGALTGRVGDFGGTIRGLAFSPDGRFLAGVGGKGLHVIDIEHMRQIAADSDYGDRNHLAFAPDGRLFTTSSDGYLRSYDASFRLVKKIKTRGGREPDQVAIDPTGEYVAVGQLDGRAVDVYRTSDLRFAFAPKTADIDADDLYSVAWSSDGRELVAGGSGETLILWDQSGRGPRHEQAVTIGGLSRILPCGDGFAVAGVVPGLALLRRDGTPVLTKAGVAVNMIEKLRDGFLVSRDGNEVRFGLGEGADNPVLFDFLHASLRRSADTSGLSPPKITGIAVTDWDAKPTPKLAGKVLKLEGEYSFSLAITPDDQRFVLGATSSLRAFDKQGRQLWEQDLPAEALGVNVTGDGRLLLAAYGDGTIRWHRMSDGKELLALFVDKDTLRWVAWTSTGYYMASPGGEDLIGWHLNRGWNQAADFFPASRFRDRFNRPDIVQLVLTTLDEDEAVKQANEAARRRADTRPLIQHLPPIIRIAAPVDGAHVQNGTVILDYALRSPSGQPVDRLDLIINGRPVKSFGLPIKPLAPNAESIGSISVTLTQHVSEVGLIAWSEGLASQPAQVKITWDGAPAVTRKLYALVIGVSDYTDPIMRLKYASKDATDFAKALQDQKGLYYADVETRVLTDRAVTRASVIEGLQWLERVATNPNDVTVLFLAGHGVTDEKQTYWFYTSDSDDNNVLINGVSQDEIRKFLQGLPGKVLWFLDTCHAGAAGKRSPVDVNVLVNTVSASENGGIVVFASSTGRQASVESGDFGNGAFTKALVEGIALGKAVRPDGFITTSSLDTYLEYRVEQLTGNQQTPVMERPPEEPDFAIAEVRK